MATPTTESDFSSKNNNAASATSTKKEEAFNSFYTEVKKIEKEDSVLTSKQQIERLLRPGSSYFNLNPFEVLQVDPELSLDDIKKKYRRLSILIHPDKNQDDQERAQQAFEVANTAWQTLENEEGYKRCKMIIKDAREYVEHMLGQQRKQLRKEGRDLPEDTDPEKMRRTLYVQTTKMFADLERKRRDQETRDAERRKREREQEIDEEEKEKAQKEFDKNFEESRMDRMHSWSDFQAKQKQKKAKKQRTMFRPPKLKPEQHAEKK